MIGGKGGGKPPVYQGIGTRPEEAAAFLRRFAELVGAIER